MTTVIFKELKVATDTRPRMVFSAMQLFREHGYNGTGIRQVVAHSETPRGSISHHFPGGKAELGVDAVAMAGDFIDAALRDALEGSDVVAGFGSFLTWWSDFLAAADFQAGCPVLAVAAEWHPESPQLATAAAGVFARWEATLAEALERAGVEGAPAQDLATLIVAAVEGAMVMCRATHEGSPLERVGARLKLALQGAVDQGRLFTSSS